MAIQIHEIIEIILFVVPDHKLPIDESTRLVDVVGDSIEYVELAMEIQGRYNIAVDRLPHYEDASVGDVIGYVRTAPKLTKTGIGRISASRRSIRI